MNALRDFLMTGRPVFGVWCTFGDVLAAETLAAGGAGFVMLDAQHGAFSPGALPGLVQAIELGGAIPMVRVGANDPQQIMKALDLGAAGVVVPLVESGAQAAAAAQATRYPPEGTRSYGPPRPAGHPSRDDDAPLCLPMVETVAGLNAVDDIAATPGVDGIFIGNIDLGLSMGLGVCAGEQPAPLVEAIARILDACKQHDVLAAGVARDATDARRLVTAGMRLVTVAADRALLAAGVRAVTADLAERPQNE